MKICLISDIHANKEALDAVLQDSQKQDPDLYICLGDLVGYGASPNEVMNIIRPLVSFTTMGNHDAAVAGYMDYRFYYEAARSVLDWTKEQLSEENMEYLKSLPYFRIDKDACFVHGEPIAPQDFNYLYTLEQANALAMNFELLQQVTFVGHSHLQRAFEMTPTQVAELPIDSIIMQPERKYAFAIGSVGQPRDYNPDAAYVTFDTEKREVRFFRVPYDIDQSADRILKAGLPEYFASRLYSGS